MNRTLHLLLLLLSALPAAAQSPYAGQESRELKALSAEDVAGYLEGKGMGFAKAAELNGLPGPMHVLELADGLALSPLQREATQRLLDRHKAEARTLGREYIEAERGLEQLMASGRADAIQVAAATSHAAALLGRVRASHLTTHVEQTALLSTVQVRTYAELRGYTGGAAAPTPGHGGHRH